MDFYDGPLFRINKLLLFPVGLWPYQSAFSKFFTTPIYIFSMVCFFLPQMAYIFEVVRNMEYDYLFSSLPTFSGSLIGITKWASIMFNSEKVSSLCQKKSRFTYFKRIRSGQLKLLLDRLKEDWNNLTIDKEVEILQSYAQIGRLLTVGYATLATGPIMALVSLPAFVPVLDLIIPLNESRPRELPYPAEYFVDQERYYYVLLTNECLSSFIALIMVAATDTMYVILIQHCCGMFAVLSYRLQNLKVCELNKLNNLEIKQEQQVVQCVSMHLRAIKFAELIESLYTSCFLFDIIFGLLGLTTACVMVVIGIDKLSDAVAFMPIVVGESVRLFFSSWIGQKLMDHSANVLNAAYAGEWYFSSERTKKLIVQLMIRCRTPCKICIAKLYIMNFDGFSKVMRAALSYCTVMTSLRETKGDI